MYRCRFEGIENTNQYEELIQVFLPKSMYHVDKTDDHTSDHTEEENCHIFRFTGDKDRLKQQIYRSLEAYTGKSPKWGILTGIRPVKLTGELLDSCGNISTVEQILKEKYLLHQDKRRLVFDILDYQRRIAGRPEKNSLSIYIGIPFCPTRCLYCSFTSNQVEESEIERYLTALHREIEYCGKKVREGGYDIESIYIGGGTPTTPSSRQLQILLEKINSSFDTSDLKEFTVEAGRPDTITAEKLLVMKNAGVTRISINPQTMKESTLQLIGRAHTVAETREAFDLAKEADMGCINTDLIAGLPEESFDDFRNSIHEAVRLGADDITLHTLAVKRASRLKEMDEGFNYRNEELREQMLSYALRYLRDQGYVPYYLYRQKHTSGNTENIGFCRDDKISVYNIRIMEEAQSILALGAGGISKVYFPDENRLERVANVSNYQIYIDRLDEMIERKEKNFWR